MSEVEREIGGYFELERFSGREYHEGAVALNCARSCLAYLIEARGIARLWVPWYLCGSVESVARRYGVDVEHFETSADFGPDYDTLELGPEDYLYLVDYYGQLTEGQILEAAKRSRGRVIVDEVMAFFRMPLEGLDTIYSCRKFFGVADGGYLYTSASLGRPLEQDASHERMGFVLGRFEGPSNDFYPQSVVNNRFFASEPIKLMSPLTHNLLRAVDYEAVALRRRENFEFLARRLDPVNELKPRPSLGAFMYPLLVEGGAELRRELQAHKLYVSLLWDSAAERDGLSGRFARDILPLPVDQRYSLDDMEYECDLLERVMRG